MIKNLLAYQEKDKERLAIVASVEGGRVKREIDAANQTIEDAKNALLSLENDAKNLAVLMQSVNKNLTETFGRVEQYDKSSKTQKQTQEHLDELKSAEKYGVALSEKVTGYDNQLEDLAKRIHGKVTAFDDMKIAIVNAQKRVAALQPGYQQAQKEIAPKLGALDAELSKIAGTVDRELFEKYKHRRKSDKSGKITDIAIPVSGGRCGGCHHEMPTLLIHKISTDGYIICENCGKILYK